MTPSIVWLAAPLDPTPDEARSLLRRELLRPEYHEGDVIDRLIDWLERVINAGLEVASGAPPLSVFAAMVVALLLLAAIGWVASRMRRTASAARSSGAALTDEIITAAQLRARAHAALTQGRHEAALVDAFRALATRQVERGRLEPTPGATAHEVAEALASSYETRGGAVRAAANRFDLVLYGDRPATAEQVRAVMALDDELSILREVTR